MELATKKTIAKEVLIFFSAIIASFIFSLIVISIMYWHYSSQLDESFASIENDENKIKELSQAYDSKKENQRAFLTHYVEYFDFDNEKLNDEKFKSYWISIEKIYSSNKLIDYYNDTLMSAFLLTQNISNFSDFNDFISKNIITKDDSLKFKESLLLNDEINSKYKISGLIYKNKLQARIHLKNPIFCWTFLIIFIVIYPLRFLFKLLKWSFDTLKKS